MKSVRKLHGLLLKIESLVLMALLISLIVIAVVQVLMRNVFDGGLLWADAYARISVLWIAMLGAMVASRHQNHIAIDIVARHLPETWKRVLARISNASTSLICFVIAWFSSDFVIQEAEYADIAFGNIPTWWCEIIIPLAFVIIALRYCIAVFLTENQTN